jgi:hypothetical protein
VGETLHYTEDHFVSSSTISSKSSNFLIVEEAHQGSNYHTVNSNHAYSYKTHHSSNSQCQHKNNVQMNTATSASPALSEMMERTKTIINFAYHTMKFWKI